MRLPPTLADLRRRAALRILSDAEHAATQQRYPNQLRTFAILVARDVVDRVESEMRWQDDGGPTS